MNNYSRNQRPIEEVCGGGDNYKQAEGDYPTKPIIRTRQFKGHQFLNFIKQVTGIF